MKGLLILSLTILSCNVSKEINTQSKDYNDSIPSCLGKMIADFEKEEVRNPPIKIYSYRYYDKTVYYIPAKCCDFFSDLYDDSCNVIGHPDGGFTGKGDGSFPNFVEIRTDEKLLWEQKKE